MSDGCPPLMTGMMWSIVGLRGWGHLREKSTGWPQIPQVFCVAYTLRLFFSNCARCGPSLSGLYLCCIVSFVPMQKAR